MLIRLPASVVSVPSLCRKLFAKRIRPNIPIHNLFPHHGPTKYGFEDWYSISLHEGKATLKVEGADTLVRISLHDDDGERIHFVHAKTRAAVVELTVRELERPGSYFVVVRTNTAYADADVNAMNAPHRIDGMDRVVRYKLTVLQ